MMAAAAVDKQPRRPEDGLQLCSSTFQQMTSYLFNAVSRLGNAASFFGDAGYSQ
jgi:hypothetical protein